MVDNSKVFIPQASYISDDKTRQEVNNIYVQIRNILARIETIEKEIAEIKTQLPPTP